MTYTAFLSADFGGDAPLRRSRKPSSQAFLCAVVLLLSASAGVAFLYAPLRNGFEAAPVIAPAAPATSRPATVPAMPVRPTAAAPARYSGMFDPNWSGSLQPLPFARAAPLRSEAPAQQVAEAEVAVPAPADQPMIVPPQQPATAMARLAPAPEVVPERTEAVPLPMRRPAFLPPEDTAPPALPGQRRPARAAVPARVPVAAAPEQPAQPSFFQRLFGMIDRPQTALGYASPDMEGLGRSGFRDGQTAIYDIAAHTVYLPNGTRLEAHSGLGAAHDDPRSVAEHMRGVTPPNVYELTPREALFHGVRALRLTPTGGTTYGRAGLLAHTYMLGPRGDSNGCVVFRNYEAFLQAYESGAVRRLVVVARLN